MNSFIARTVLFSMALAVCLVPLYAHHGTQFLSKALEMNTAEAKLAEMAAAKAENPRVKEYAQMLARDHNEAINKIRQLQDTRMADSGSTKPQQTKAEVKLTPEHQRISTRLSSLSGAEFDRAFMNEMVKGHRTAIRMFETQARVHGNAANKKQTSNADAQIATREKPAPADSKYSRADLRRDMDTSDFAIESLPTLKNHLQQAESISKELRGTGANTTDNKNQNQNQKQNSTNPTTNPNR